ncbi:MAG: sigma-70 family RNA polymerase sigma factor [Pseudomonadota bacterium]
MADLQSTTRLIERYRDGEPAARDALVARYLPILRRWAHGRLPPQTRDATDTDDLVQVTFMRAINRLDHFEAERPGAFLSYLRTIFMNLVRDEVRRRAARPKTEPLAQSLPAQQSSQVERAVGQEVMAAYERGLNKLPENKRLAVIMRVEFGMGFDEVAEELALASPNAARMMVSRALDKLATFLPDDTRRSS